MTTDYEVLREVWKITEYRNGCIFKTEYTGEDRWVGEHEKPANGYQFVSFSTEKGIVYEAEHGSTIRRKPQ